MHTAANGHVQVVVELIRAGADVSVVSNEDWYGKKSVAASSTALHFAGAVNNVGSSSWRQEQM